MNCTVYVAKTKALISFAVTAKLICVFVFAYAKRWISHDVAQVLSDQRVLIIVYCWVIKRKKDKAFIMEHAYN